MGIGWTQLKGPVVSLQRSLWLSSLKQERALVAPGIGARRIERDRLLNVPESFSQVFLGCSNKPEPIPGKRVACVNRQRLAIGFYGLDVLALHIQRRTKVTPYLSIVRIEC